MWQAERSWTSSDVQTGSAVSGHVGQMHSAVLFTVRQPMLYGALQPTVSHGSGSFSVKEKKNIFLALLFYYLLFEVYEQLILITGNRKGISNVTKSDYYFS